MFTNCRSHFIHCNTLIYNKKLVRDCIRIETYNTIYSKEIFVLYVLICNGIEWCTCLKNCWDFFINQRYQNFMKVSLHVLYASFMIKKCTLNYLTKGEFNGLTVKGIKIFTFAYSMLTTMNAFAQQDMLLMQYHARYIRV